MSDIFGKGWGDDHDWERGSTAQVGNNWAAKGTNYHCRNCGETFYHAYDIIPDIFVAMERSGVPEHCPKAGAGIGNNNLKGERDVATG